MIKYAIAASGKGTIFHAVINAQRASKIPHGQIVALITDTADAGAMGRAQAANISSHFIDHTQIQEDIDKAIIKVLKSSGAQFLFLTGFKQKISPTVLKEVPVYNTLPALDLGKFGRLHGIDVHQAVIKARRKFTGATIHEVGGKTLMQTSYIDVLKDDTPEALQKRVQTEEYKQAIKFLDNLTRKMNTTIVVYGRAQITRIQQDAPQAKVFEMPSTTEIDDCLREEPYLVIVSDENSLALGLVDKLTEKGARAFGPTQAAAEIVLSKHFAKDFMRRHSIPTANFCAFNNNDDALTYVKDIAPHPLVVKTNGSKKAIISRNLDQSERAIHSMDGTIIIEELLTGPEMTLTAFIDGKDYSLMPTTISTSAVEKEIIKPTIKGLTEEGREFKGILNFDLMITSQGIKLIEYNTHFGDIDLLETNLLDIMNACIDGTLDHIKIKWKKGARA